jgi:hypothetical protein
MKETPRAHVGRGLYEEINMGSLTTDKRKNLIRLIYAGQNRIEGWIT